MRKALVAIALALLPLGGCATYTDDLTRAQARFLANDYDRTLAMCRLLEPDIDSLSSAERARFAYLYGMTTYRMQLRGEARHWLGVSRLLERRTPGSLDAAWKERLDEALKDLDARVYGGAEASADLTVPPGMATAAPGAPPPAAPTAAPPGGGAFAPIR